ncbi:MAG: 50S ribosomal protein L10 [Nanoarchaeota archaeon]
MKSKKTAKIPERKKKEVEQIVKLIKDKKTILIASIKNLPASQFQEIGKKLRGKAIVKVPKKSLMIMSIDNSKNEELKKLKEHIKEDFAVLFSDLDCFELSSELVESKSPARAKAGQESPQDIEVPAGPTDLIPGPAITELGALGIQIQIEKGKISIKEPKIIVKTGEKISSGAADIMNKLDIKPFSVGFVPLVAFDIKSGKLYTSIVIDKKGALEGLTHDFGKAMAFAVKIGYICKDTIRLLIGKAGMHEKAIETIASKGNTQEETKEEIKNE